MKKKQFFYHEVFFLFAVATMFLEVVLFLEASVLKTPDCMSG